MRSEIAVALDEPLELFSPLARDWLSTDFLEGSARRTPRASPEDCEGVIGA
jgi:hypothetical protein